MWDNLWENELNVWDDSDMLFLQLSEILNFKAMNLNEAFVG